MTFELLDCTLRDGGYYTNWDFTPDITDPYLSIAPELPLSYLEIGYRNSRQNVYRGEYYYCPEYTIGYIYDKLQGRVALALMIDAKNYLASDMKKLLTGLKGRVELVRLAIDPVKISHALTLAEEIKNLGFKVAINVMYLHKFDQFKAHYDAFGTTGFLDYVYLVDSYGSCFPEEVSTYVKALKEITDCKLGIHCHDNINLAFANTLAGLKAGAEIADGTMLGMGRGAGNARTEVLLAYFSKYFSKDIDFSPLSEFMEKMTELKSEHKWGSKIPYVISGMREMPQNVVMNLISKRRYTTSNIIDIISEQSSDKLDEQVPPLHEENPDRMVLIVGGGSSVVDHGRAIREFVKRNDAIVIHVSLRNRKLFQDIGCTQFVCLVGQEAEKLQYHDDTGADVNQFVISSPPRLSPYIRDEWKDRLRQVEPYLKGDDKHDLATPLGLALGTAQALQAQQIYLAGFDGYGDQSEIQLELDDETHQLIDSYQTDNKDIPLISLTPTTYNILIESVYGANLHAEN